MRRSSRRRFCEAVRRSRKARQRGCNRRRFAPRRATLSPGSLRRPAGKSSRRSMLLGGGRTHARPAVCLSKKRGRSRGVRSSRNSLGRSAEVSFALSSVKGLIGVAHPSVMIGNFFSRMPSSIGPDRMAARPRKQSSGTGGPCAAATVVRRDTRMCPSRPRTWRKPRSSSSTDS